MKAATYKESYFRTVSILTQYMKENKITVSETAQILDIPRKKVGEVLKGKRIDIETLDYICRLVMNKNVKIEIR